jgi:photosystem II stability/assembly factor-like uncharacterized protein
MKASIVRSGVAAAAWLLVVALLGAAGRTHGAVDPADWTWMSPLPQGHHLNAVWLASPSNVFAVGENGSILHFDGSQWRAQSSGTSYHLHALWGSAANNVFAVGNAGLILHYDGSTWVAMPSGTAAALYAVWGRGGDDVYAAGEGGSVLHFDGSQWQTVVAPGSLSGLPLRGIWGSAGGELFVVGGTEFGGGVLLRYAGGSWRSDTALLPTFNPQLNAVWGSSANDVWAAGGATTSLSNNVTGTLLHFDGSDWSVIEQPPFFVTALWGSGASDLHAVGDKGNLLRYDGQAWSTSSLAVDSQFRLHGVYGSAADAVFLVGNRGLIARFDGLAWQELSAGFKDELRGLWGSSPNNIYLLRRDLFASRSYIDRYNGSSWATVWPSSGSSSIELNAIWGSAADDIYVVTGDGYNYLHFDGNQWQWRQLPDFDRKFAVWGTGPNNVYAGGENRLHRFDGSSWSTVLQGFYRIQAIWGSAETNIWAAGREGELFQFDGSAWTQRIKTSDLQFGLHGCTANNVLVVGRRGHMVRFDGSTWQEVPGLPDDYWLEDVRFLTADNAFAVARHGGSARNEGAILHFDGSQWRTLRNLSLALSALWKDGERLYAVGDRGAILRYGDDLRLLADGFEDRRACIDP